MYVTGLERRTHVVSGILKHSIDMQFHGDATITKGNICSQTTREAERRHSITITKEVVFFHMIYSHPLLTLTCERRFSIVKQ